MNRYVFEYDTDNSSYARFFRGKEKLSEKLNTYLNFIAWRNPRQHKMMLRTNGNTLNIFTNDINVLKSLEDVDENIIPTHTEVNLESEPDTILLNNPNHHYRIYFKSRSIKDGFHEEVAEFLDNRKNSVFPCNALIKWAHKRVTHNWYMRWTHSSHFIEYDDESMLTIIKLYFGDILGKVYKIEKRIKQS